MPKSHTPYPPEFRRRMVEFVRSGRSPDELAENFEPTAQSIRNWVAQGTAISVDDGRPDYGFQWWLLGRTEPGLPADLYAALGHDGQFIYVIPSLDLVVVRSGHYDKHPGPPMAQGSLWALYPSDGLIPGRGTVPPDSWSDREFLAPILASIDGAE